jgi:hypothetical protein
MSKHFSIGVVNKNTGVLGVPPVITLGPSLRRFRRRRRLVTGAAAEKR